MEKITIHQVETADAATILPYVIGCRKLLFPMLDHGNPPKDLAFFVENYLESTTGVFLQARTSDGRLAGVIGMMPYDYRFPHLEIDAQSTVEVARLFVEPEFRRTGLGTQLFEALKAIAAQKKIQRLYLHTHPFLTGAYEFWLNQGFTLLDYRIETGFQTLHMELMTDVEIKEYKHQDLLVYNENTT